MKSWIYIGIVALAAGTSFTGCTITTSTGDNGGAGGEGGSGGSGGDGGSGGAADQGGAAGSAGASTDGGSAAQGGTSSTSTTTAPSFESAVAALCALKPVIDCLSTCVDDYTSLKDQFPACEAVFAAQFSCQASLPISTLTCGSDGTPQSTSSACDSEIAAVDACAVQ